MQSPPDLLATFGVGPTDFVFGTLYLGFDAAAGVPVATLEVQTFVQGTPEPASVVMVGVGVGLAIGWAAVRRKDWR